MYYSAIGMIAIAIFVIINHKIIKAGQNIDGAGGAYQKFIFTSLLYFVTDVMWGILSNLKLAALLYADTVIYYIAMALTVVFLCNYVIKYLELQSAFGKFIKTFGYVFAAAEFVLLLINHFIPIFFRVYSDATYQAFVYRYLALYMQVFLCLLLVIQTGIVMIGATGDIKKRYFTIFSFCLVMAAAIIAQILYPLLPIYAVGLLIGGTIIHTFVNEGEKEEQLSILKSMADINYSMHVIDLTRDEVIVLSARNEVKEIVNKRSGAMDMMCDVINAVTAEEYLDAALKFTDLSTLAERMRDRKTITLQFVGKNVGWVMAMFITIETDPYGKPTKVIFTTRIIEEEKKNEEKLVKKTIVDELTGLYNRRAYEEDIAKYSTQAVSEDFVYASIDVNGLKAVNDEIGHAAGDELLRGAADCLKQAFGKYGKVYRIGGDEFISIFSADKDRLETIRADLKNITEKWSGEMVGSLSLSVGYVIQYECEKMSILEIAKIADKRMYQAKSEYYRKKGVDRRRQSDR